MISILRIVKTLAVLAFLVCPISAQPYSWPAWSAQTATGSEFHSRQLEGKVVVVSIWGSWCPTCRKLLPVLNSLQVAHQQKGLQVLAFSLDKSPENHQEFVQDHQLTVPSIFARNGDGLEVVKMLQEGAGSLEVVPTLLIYDKRGRLAHRTVGFLNRQELDNLLTPLLEEKS